MASEVVYLNIFHKNPYLGDLSAIENVKDSSPPADAIGLSLSVY